MQTLFINLFKVLNYLAALALLLAYSACFVNPEFTGIPAFFGIGFPVFLFINVAFVLFWLFVRWRHLWLSTLLILAGYPVVQRHIQLFPNGKASTEQGLQVVTYNLRNFTQAGTKQRKKNLQGIMRLMDSLNADIYCFQEFYFNRKLNFRLNGAQLVAKGKNPVFTNLAIAGKGNLLDDKDNKLGVYVDLVNGSDTLRVINVQLLSYSVSRDIEDYEQHPDKEMPKKRVITIAQKLEKGFTRRVTESKRLKRFIQQSPYPVILCGDLNDPPASYTYQQIISTGLKDAFVESGKGYGNTYNGYLPNVRIDYILCDSRFECYNYGVIHADFSDHFPVTALINFVKVH